MYDYIRFILHVYKINRHKYIKKPTVMSKACPNRFHSFSVASVLLPRFLHIPKMYNVKRKFIKLCRRVSTPVEVTFVSSAPSVLRESKPLPVCSPAANDCQLQLRPTATSDWSLYN